MGIRDQVARIIDRHEWSRLDGGTTGQQIASDLAAKGLLRIEQQAVPLHRVSPGDVVTVILADVVPDVKITRLYEITVAEELDSGEIELWGQEPGANPAAIRRVLVGHSDMIVWRLGDR